MNLPKLVRAIQRELVKQGHRVTVDGDAGEETLKAVHAELLGYQFVDDAPRTISSDGLALVKEFEGLYLKAYQDSVGVWTIGWGHTGLKHNDGTVRRGRVVTREQAEDLLRYDMHQFEKRVNDFVKVPLSDDEFSALVSFDFNTGGLGRSTLLKRLNAGDRVGAADEFLKWNKAGGKVLRGLTRRRQSERNLFLGKRPFIVA